MDGGGPLFPKPRKTLPLMNADCADSEDKVAQSGSWPPPAFVKQTGLSDRITACAEIELKSVTFNMVRAPRFPGTMYRASAAFGNNLQRSVVINHDAA
jgi:hypothetical protein